MLWSIDDIIPLLLQSTSEATAGTLSGRGSYSHGVLRWRGRDFLKSNYQLAGKSMCFTKSIFYHHSDNINMLVCHEVSLPKVPKFRSDQSLVSWTFRQDAKYMNEGDYVTLVQSGSQSIWREESTHHIQVRKVQCWCRTCWSTPVSPLITREKFWWRIQACYYSTVSCYDYIRVILLWRTLLCRSCSSCWIYL